MDLRFVDSAEISEELFGRDLLSIRVDCYLARIQIFSLGFELSTLTAYSSCRLRPLPLSLLVLASCVRILVNQVDDVVLVLCASWRF